MIYGNTHPRQLPRHTWDHTVRWHGHATSSIASSGSVSTDEANGTLYWLTNTSSTAIGTAVKAGSNQAVTATGTQNTTSTGLTAGTTYYTHFLHRDAAGNDSTVLSSASFTTPVPDTTDPTLTGSITVGAKTSSTINISWPAGSDNVAVTGYEVHSNGGVGPWIDVGNVLTYTITGLPELTSRDLLVRAYDAAGNYSSHLSVTTSTYRAGALGSTILLTTGPVDGNPAGILYNDVATDGSDDAKWFSFYIVTAPASGTLDINPDGTFTFTGPDATTFTYQLEVDGVAVGSPTLVTLYTSSGGGDGGIMTKQQLSMKLGISL